jgi:hypothetical protein
MYEVLFPLIGLLLLALVIRETLREHFLGFLPNAVKVGGNDWFNTDPHGDGYEIYNTTPNTCPPNKSDLDAGLCYTACRSGYHGVGPVCWVDSVNVGVGTVVGLEPCPDGWSNDGLTCREPIRNDCSWKGLFGECWGRLQGGRIVGRLDHGGVCPGPGGGDDHTDKKDGLCYRPCPKDLPNRIPGMPYLCYKGGDLSYGRGVGSIPSIVRIAGKYNPI